MSHKATETLTVVSKYTSKAPMFPTAVLTVIDKATGEKKEVGPFGAALVCDILVGDTFTWDGEDVHTLKIVGAASPAPTDWAKQGDILFSLREEAIAYILGNTETAFFVYSGMDIVYSRAEDGKRMITVNWDGEDSNEAEMEAVEDLDISTLVMLCTAIEKALAAGGQKP